VYIGLDFDGTIVTQERPYEDVTSPLEFVEGAREGLLALKAAGHVLMLWSARASRALLLDPSLDPLVRCGAKEVNRAAWEQSRHVHRARYDQMIDFVERELPGVFACIDDGLGGKPLVDLFIEDKAFVMRGPGTWARLVRTYGEPPEGEPFVPLALLDRPVASLNLVPTGPLKDIIASVVAELKAAGITHFEPHFALGDAGFWCADRAITVNIPWYLATPELKQLAEPRYPTYWSDVLRGVRHEVGHAVNYAFELWKRDDWKKTFGDFKQPYPESRPWPYVADSPDFVQYVKDSGPGYAQRHPDEDFAETFAVWLDPGSHWPERYTAGALKKLNYVAFLGHRVLGGWPTNLKLGVPREWRAAYPGQTVAQALAVPEPPIEGAVTPTEMHE
jgi:hypothetical protein